MLVLTRRKGQSIMIGEDIEISIEEVSGDAVRVGIRAPREISVHRREIYDAIREENISAIRSAAEMANSLKELATPPWRKEKTEDEP